MARAETGARAVLKRLAGEECPQCDRGELVRERYKGNRAVICDSCETPRAQVWR